MQNCLSTHAHCSHATPAGVSQKFPVRLIDLSDSDCPKLRETSEIKSRCDLQYLTLSYCWGRGIKLKTKRASYDEFFTRIPIDGRLPKTFKEAFQVAQTLGYRYIWIDAFCIVQDDPNEVQQEMNLMGDIYANSTLTIAAASGLDTSSGLFIRRDARWLKRCNVSITMVEDAEVLQGSVGVYVADSRKKPDPLSSRGWIFQEQILSTRTLIYGPYGMTWSCVSENFSEGLPYHNFQSELEVGQSLQAGSLMLKLPSSFADMKRANNHRLDHFDAWYQLVESYSLRDLSFLTDKLPAVAGLASVMQANYQCTYGVGLWKEDLQIGLVWYVECHGQDSDETTTAFGGNLSLSKEYIAPSFSWASIAKGKITFCDYEENGRHLRPEGLQTIDWNFTYVPGPLVPFGEVRSGTLTVRAYFRKALLIPCWDEWHSNTPSCRYHNARWRGHAADPNTGRPFGDVALDSFKTYDKLSRAFKDATPDFAKAKYSRTRHSFLETDRQYYECRSCKNQKDSYRSTPPESLWYMSKAQPIWSLLCLVREKYDHRQLVALILTPCDNGDRTYRRIGLLFVRDEAVFKNWMEPGEVQKYYQTVQIV